MLKLNFSVIVTPACAADMEAKVLVAYGIPECALPLLVVHVSIGCDRRVVKMIHEQHMVLVGDLGVLHKTSDKTACGSKEGPVAVLYPASVDFCNEDVACLGLAQQEALDAPLTDLSHTV